MEQWSYGTVGLWNSEIMESEAMGQWGYGKWGSGTVRLWNSEVMESDTVGQWGYGTVRLWKVRQWDSEAMEQWVESEAVGQWGYGTVRLWKVRQWGSEAMEQWSYGKWDSGTVGERESKSVKHLGNGTVWETNLVSVAVNQLPIIDINLSKQTSLSFPTWFLFVTQFDLFCFPFYDKQREVSNFPWFII